ncbi:hypothetical protein [Halioxenophilus sp. WMMB6]|uniref:sulfotransferase family protein n=1 Tax=Halioxenophilus sp. WMMB6 TaxID=3073815 RepID=UPI00295E358B|nr:hypothetical protein [Halioxenophilus sp. WMMB6]
MASLNEAQRVIAVLGMHRSGTSCLTGSLQKAGLELGNCHTWNPYNQKGNRENQAFVDLNDEILAANKGAWNIPPKKVEWSAEQLAKGQELLTEHEQIPVLGFKDPRTLLVLDGWKKIIKTMEFVGIFRSPIAVAKSLAHRNNMPNNHAYELWYRYNKALYKEYKRHPFPVLCFDLPEAQFNEKVDRVVKELALNAIPDTDRFYEAELNNHANSEPAKLPWKVQRLYRKLQAISY